MAQSTPWWDIAGHLDAGAKAALGGLPMEAIMEFFAWVFDPARLVSWALAVMSYLFNLLGYLLPGDVGVQFQGFGDKMSAVPIQSIFAVAGWLVSPVVDPLLMLTCLGIMLDVWVLSIALKLVLYVKGHIWSSSH